MEDELRKLRAELKRRDRIIVRFSVATLIVLILIVGYGTAELRHMRNIVNMAQTKLAEPVETIKGDDGKDGEDGLTIIGPQGVPGQNAVSTQTIVEQPIIQQAPVPVPVPVKGDKGDQGEPGEQGKPGRSVEIATRQGRLLWRYIGDTLWHEPEEVNE